MKEFSEYSNSELISLLMDGQLDKAQEETLYQSISSDGAMQEELQELLSIRESIKLDHEAYNPPAHLTNSVFSSLGYSSPYGTAPIAAAGTVAKSTFFSKMIPYMMVMLVGAAGWFYFQSESETVGNDIPVVSSVELTGDNLISGNNFENNASSVKSDNIVASTANSDNNKMLISGNANPVNANIVADNIPASNVVNSANMQQDYSNELEHNKFSLIPVDYSDGFANSFSLNNFSSRSAFDLINFNKKSNFSPYWYVQALGIFANSMANTNLPTQSSVAWSNINFGLFRQMSNDFSLGIQFGMEPFNIYQTDNNDIPFISSQDVLWVTAAFRYDMNFASLYGAKPYVSLGAGGSTIGFMSRGMLGIHYDLPSTPIGLNVGYEATMINYSIHQDYTATKNGIIAGFNIKF